MQTLIKAFDQARLDCILTLTRSLSKRITLDEVTSTKRTLYESLGVSSKATQGEIKAAYYKLSLAYHPDKNYDNEDAVKKFREITDAYDVLGSYRSRRMYDQGIVVDRTKTTTTEEVLFRRHNESGPSRTRGPIIVGHTSAYNFDEWTKRHYGECLENAFETKRVVNRKKERNELTDKTRRLEMTLVWLFVVLFIVAALSIEYDYDNPEVNLVVETLEPKSSSDNDPSLD